MTEKMFNMNKVDFLMKASKKPFISFGVISTIFYIFKIANDFSKGWVSWHFFATKEGLLYFLQTTFLIYSVLIILSIWFLGFKVIIEDGVLIYKTLFGVKEISLKDIQKYKIQHGYGGWNNLRKPYFRLELFTKKQKDPEIMLNLNIFGYADCKELYDILNEVVEENKMKGKE